MKHTNSVIIGGGQAGLALSRCLTEKEIDHVVIERGRIGERWRSERWDSLRLLSPNWMSRLPHYSYKGDNPDGFMTMVEFIRYLEDYAESFEAPVQTGTCVQRVEQIDSGYRIITDRGTWHAANVVIATGFCDVPRVPAFANRLPERIQQIVPSEYRNPGQLSPGGVLVVGASATGAQIAEEVNSAGYQTILAVGNHVRLPRRYRGKDILHWMVSMGGFAAAANPEQERQSPPPQLIGAPDNRDLDLGKLQFQGVELIGRVIDADEKRVRFEDDLAKTVGKADDDLRQLLAKIDSYIETKRYSAEEPDPFREIVPNPARTQIDLEFEGITNVVWATGYKRHLPWLKVRVVDQHGDVEHDRGVTAVPGLYVLGMRFQRTKGSNLIDGVGDDAEYLAGHIADSTRTRYAA